MTPDFIHLTKFFSNPKVFSTLIKNWWSTESKPFSISIVNSKPLIFIRSVISKMPGINRPPSLINLLSTLAVWFENIKDGKCFLILLAQTLEISFASMLSRDISLQFLINLLSVFFSICLLTVVFEKSLILQTKFFL